MTPPRDEPGAPLQARLGEFITLRRAIHAQPELAFAEHATAALVAARLTQFGYTVTRGLGGTGLVGTLRRGSGPRAIGIRADMDALPMSETGARPWRSQIESRMHACGHDGHTAMLLGAAKYLSETRNFAGTAVVIFQPAEEGGGGGKAMIDDGLIDRFGITEVYGMHNMPGLPVGHFAVRPGPIMAAADRFVIEIEGKGSHAAKPNESNDTIIIVSQLVTAFQSIVSRNLDPLESGVCSVTYIKAGDAFNVLPQTATLKGTCRSLKPEVRDLLERRMREICAGIAATFGAKIDIEYFRGYPVTFNHEKETDFSIKVASEVSGGENVLSNIQPTMGAEDFR